MKWHPWVTSRNSLLANILWNYSRIISVLLLIGNLIVVFSMHRYKTTDPVITFTWDVRLELLSVTEMQVTRHTPIAILCWRRLCDWHLLFHNFNLSEFHKRNWKSLPAETYHYIFQKVLEKDILECVLVCKAWLLPTQSILYSNVCVDKFEHLKNFYRTVEHNPQLGMKVKKLELGDDFDLDIFRTKAIIRKRKTLRILTSLLSTHLPNIETVHKDFQGLYTNQEILVENLLSVYISVLNALTKSRLRSLKRLPMPSPNAPKSQMVTYLGCTLLMKDRMENLMLADNFESHLPSSEQVFFNQFHSQLNQFDKLVEIHIRREINEPIQFLHDIVENCPSLKHLEYHFSYNKNEPFGLKCNASAEAVSKYTPRFNLEMITTDAIEMVEGGTLPYTYRTQVSSPSKAFINPRVSWHF